MIASKAVYLESGIDYPVSQLSKKFARFPLDSTRGEEITQPSKRILV